ncbi:MAG: AtuA-related protein [Vulcanimicrobiaceae bacterium]
MAQVADLATGRSGDKGNIANVVIVARSEAAHAQLKQALTVECVRTELCDLVRGRVERYALDNLHVLNFVLYDALDGGATRSLRFDTLGKSLADRVLAMSI